MSSAFNLTIRAGQNTLLIDNQAVLAFTDWLVIGHDALLVKVARCASTWIKTFAILAVASCSERTVLVALTADWLDNLGLGGKGVTRRIRATSYMWTANMTLWTFTSWFVNANSANGVYSTRSSKTTRIYTFALFARLAGRTVKVCSAFAFFL